MSDMVRISVPMLYVDRDAVIKGSEDIVLNLAEGWNIYTVRFPSDETVFQIEALVDDALLDIFIP